MMWAERELADDKLLTIHVHGRLSDGSVYTNTDVYRRDIDAEAIVNRGPLEPDH